MLVVMVGDDQKAEVAIRMAIHTFHVKRHVQVEPPLRNCCRTCMKEGDRNGVVVYTW
jgi:hypothetical protein